MSATNQPIWTPSETWINATNMAAFIKRINTKFAQNFSTYPELYAATRLTLVETSPVARAAQPDILGHHLARLEPLRRRSSPRNTRSFSPRKRSDSG